MAMMSYVHEIQTVYNVVQEPQMVLLSEKEAHGVSVRREKVCMLLPRRSRGTLENQPIASLLQAKPCWPCLHGLRQPNGQP